LIEAISNNEGFICGDDDYLYSYTIDTTGKFNKTPLTPSNFSA